MNFVEKYTLELFMNREIEIINLTEKTLEKHGIKTDDLRNDFQFYQAIKRQQNKEFLLSEYISGLIYSQLSAQRKWKQIAYKKEKINEIFAYFEYKEVLKLAKNPQNLIDDLQDIKAGNRMLKEQMVNLEGNIVKLVKIHKFIEQDYPKRVTFHQNKEYALKYVELFTSERSEFRLSYIGYALACEFLKNIGIPIPKLDVHILRILGNERLGIIPQISENFTIEDKIKAINEFYLFVQRNSLTIADVVYYDSLFWNLGANEYGEICTKNPKCELCYLTNHCNYNK